MDNKYIYVSSENENKTKPITKSKSSNTADTIFYVFMFIGLIVFTGGIGVGILLAWGLMHENKSYEMNSYHNRIWKPYLYEYSKEKKEKEQYYTDEQKQYLKEHPWVFINRKGEYEGSWRYIKNCFWRDKLDIYSNSPRYKMNEYIENHPEDSNFVNLAQRCYESFEKKHQKFRTELKEKYNDPENTQHRWLTLTNAEDPEKLYQRYYN